MAEETLPFFAILLPIVMAMGYDSITAFMIVFVGARIGYIASTVNPFNVLIAQGILNIQVSPALASRCCPCCADRHRYCLGRVVRSKGEEEPRVLDCLR